MAVSGLAGVAKVYGVDFSGAVDGGRMIWIASCVLNGGAIQLSDCRPASELPNGSRALLPALAALRATISASGAAVWGLDFPFSLADPYLPYGTWIDFVSSFRTRYPTADEFYQASRGWKGARRTDRETKTPFAPHNLRLYRQTYYGIRDVLAPLVTHDHARVAPMDDPTPDKPLLLEICPASTLKAAGMYAPYKGKTADHRRGRERLWAWLTANGLIGDDPARILDDSGGDALDSVIAAWTVARLITTGVPITARDTLDQREGRVYA